MSIMNAMNTGVSGLDAEGQALGVAGDNISNVNTVGFKQSRAVFEDVLGGAMGDRNATGAGVQMVRAQQIFAQGSLTTTGQPTDLALSGDGFFVVKGTVDGQTGDFYTRAGQTTLNQDGKLVNPDGLAIQGYQANPDGTYSSQIGDIQVPTGALPPKTTGSMTITANLNSSDPVPAGAWDPQNPGATSSTSTSMTIYDSLGNAHAVDVYARQDGNGSWEYHALANGSELTPPQAGNVEIASGTLQFNTDGSLQSQTPNASAGASFSGATPNQQIAVSFGNPIASGGTGLGGTTQFGSPDTIASQTQDGYASGALTGVSVDESGVVSGNYSNGQKVPVAELAVAKFQSNDGLGRAGHNLWVATTDSGQAALGAANTGGRASVVSGALEQSNVDIAAQFVDMISHQRAFQADSKTITTADEMLQTVVALKQ